MNDFAAKPIEVRTLIQKVRKWLPKEQIIPCRTMIDMDAKENVSQNTYTVSIEGLDTIRNYTDDYAAIGGLNVLGARGLEIP